MLLTTVLDYNEKIKHPQKINNQCKTNLRERIKRLVQYLREKGPYPLRYENIGSLSKGSGEEEVYYDEKKGYDLDINIISKFEDSASAVGHRMILEIKKALRKNETTKRKTRVQFIGVKQNGYFYNYDIAFIKSKNNRPWKILVHENNSFKWRDY